MYNIVLEKCALRFVQTEALGISFMFFQKKHPAHISIFILFCAMHILNKHSLTELQPQPWMYTLTAIYLQIVKYLCFFQIGTVPGKPLWPHPQD